MSNYRRAFIAGGTYFFTVNLLQRQDNDLLIQKIDLLREVVTKVRKKYPFRIDAWVVLPNHLHCVWTLPPNETNFSLRWRLIKSGFSRNLPKTEYRSKIRSKAKERGIWQRHYWEHLIRNDLDYQRRIDYIHINPMKHGLVENVINWPYSTFHQYIDKGLYLPNWGSGIDISVAGGE